MKFITTFKHLVFFILYIAFSSLYAQELKSPSENFRLLFELKSGVPTYSLQLEGKPVIKESKLGLVLKDAESLVDGFTI